MNGNISDLKYSQEDLTIWCHHFSGNLFPILWLQLNISRGGLWSHDSQCGVSALSLSAPCSRFFRVETSSASFIVVSLYLNCGLHIIHTSLLLNKIFKAVSYYVGVWWWYHHHCTMQGLRKVKTGGSMVFFLKQTFCAYLFRDLTP